MAIEATSSGPQVTRLMGEALGRLLLPGDVLCFVGPLGAGKTCFIQGIVRGMHPQATYPVRSPSFTMIAEYPGPVPVYHVDLFRIEGHLGDAEVGVEDLFGSDVICLIEWADRCPGWLPPERLDVKLSVTGPEERKIAIVPRGERWKTLAPRIRQVLLEAS